jgi:hypothetical protein
MSARALLIRLVVTAAIMTGGAATALADPPGRVGRLSYMEGTVSFHTADQDQWSPAILNYPVVTGSSVWTEPQSRVEIQVGSSEIRMDQQTELDVQRLDDQAVQIQVAQGVVNLHLHATPAPGEIQVATPAGQVELLREGSYRIDAGHPDANGGPPHVEVVVLEGEARLNGERATLDIQPSEGAVISGSPTSFTLVAAEATPFDNWALSRERREMESQTARYVSPETTGTQDLDQYGHWSTLPDVGPVWTPAAVPADWAPYRDGHWAFVSPWGWTWIDDAPWGFAPFHYGRWLHTDRGWGWCPGVVVEARPIYAPALVAFVGGAGWSISLHIGDATPAVGWVPLGPAEVFHPYYQTSPTYVRNVNVTNIKNINNVNITNVTNNVTVTKYVNQQAATVVPTAAFTHAMPTHQAALAVSPQQMAQAPTTPTMTQLQPTPAARAGMAQPTSGGVAPAPVAMPPHPAGGQPHPVAGQPPTQQPVTPQSQAPHPAAPEPQGVHPAAPATASGPAVPHPAETATPAHPQAQPTAEPQQGVHPTAPNAAPGPAINHPTETAAPAHPQAQPTAEPQQVAHPTAPAAVPAPGPAVNRPAETAAPARPQAQPAPEPQAMHPQPAPAPQPAPQIVHPATPAPAAAPVVQHPAPQPQPQPQAVRPPAPVEHPVQQTHLAPSPQGWVRQPEPPHPAAAPPAAAPQQQKQSDPRKKEEPQHP